LLKCLVTVASAIVFSPGFGDAQQWSSSVEYTLDSPSGGNSYWGAIGGIAVAPSRMYVFDRLEHRLFAYDQSGARQWNAGGRGKGPGEFTRGRSVLTTSSDLIIVPDPGNSRLTVFDRNGKYKTAHDFENTTGIPAEWVALGERIVYMLNPLPTAGLMLRPGMATKTLVIIRDFAGTEDTVARLVKRDLVSIQEAGQLVLYPRPNRPLMASDGKVLYVTSGDSYEIQLTSSDGTSSGTIKRIVPSVPISGRERASMEVMVDTIRKTLPASFRSYRIRVEYPAKRPVIAQMVAGDGKLLVQRADIAAKDGRRIWDIFVGVRYAGYLALPPGFTAEALSGSRLYGTMTDDMDVQTVIVMNFKPPSQ